MYLIAINAPFAPDNLLLVSFLILFSFTAFTEFMGKWHNFSVLDNVNSVEVLLCNAWYRVFQDKSIECC